MGLFSSEFMRHDRTGSSTHVDTWFVYTYEAFEIHATELKLASQSLNVVVQTIALRTVTTSRPLYRVSCLCMHFANKMHLANEYTHPNAQ